MVDPNNSRRLAGKTGTGVMINGKTGRTRSLVTKRRDFDDVELHLEFIVARGSNSGVIFHGLHEIQILDSHGVKKPTAGHCGGIYPRAETKPSYHYIDKGSPPRVNAAQPPGQWQTLDIIFQGDYGPVALRNVRVRPRTAGDEKLNVPPEGFTHAAIKSLPRLRSHNLLPSGS